MAMTNVAAFAQTPDTAAALLTAAVANLTSLTPTGIVQAFTAGPNGAIITRISAIPRGSVTATAIYMLKSVDGGTSWHLKDSETIPFQTVVATAAISETPFPNYSETRPFRLGAGEIIGFGLGAAQASGIEVDVEYTNF